MINELSHEISNGWILAGNLYIVMYFIILIIMFEIKKKLFLVKFESIICCKVVRVEIYTKCLK